MNDCPIAEIVQVVQAVEGAKKRIPPKLYGLVRFFGKDILWQFHAVIDDKTCELCAAMSKIAYFPGTHVRFAFIHLKIKDEDTIVGDGPNETGLVHPNCRCWLSRVKKQ